MILGWEYGDAEAGTQQARASNSVFSHTYLLTYLLTYLYDCVAQARAGNSVFSNTYNGSPDSEGQTPHMAHSHAVHLPLGALLSPCATCVFRQPRRDTVLGRRRPGVHRHGYHRRWRDGGSGRRRRLH